MKIDGSMEAEQLPAWLPVRSDVLLEWNEAATGQSLAGTYLPTRPGYGQ